MRVAGTHRELGRRLVLAVPYVWLLVFFLAPLLIVGKISLSESRLGIPPYEPLIDWAQSGLAMVKVSLNNYVLLFEDDLYVQAYIQSLTIAGISTFLCLLIGYPMALGIARAPEKARGPLLLLVIVPFWTSFLIRVYSWMSILRDEGILNHALMAVGLIDEPLIILNTDWAVYVGIVYSYLPFMVLPLYASLEKLDPSLLEAAADLGARPVRAFIAVTLPLSLPGIVAGSMLVFVPAVGEYVIPSLLGGGDTQMLGKALWDVFAQTRDWPAASALAMAMLAALVLPIALFQRLQTRLEEEENR
ncbi:MAG: putrescine transport system permease [Rhodospirillaceae bacterium]|nr:MAG: putrescine transport system permease [Rhodospirillaceae bacterium]TNC96744.1 MAG: putrescine transport system permease protein [Stygiobacter sp.]